VTVTKTFPKPQPTQLPNVLCPFAVDIIVVKNKETAIETVVTHKSDGSLVSDTTLTTGPLILKFSNDSNPTKSITRDVSGSTVDVTKPTTETFVGTGSNWLGFGPGGQHNTGEPGVVITHGLVKLTINPTTHTVLTFSLKGSQENVCALLS
jgi:hypothetical protein